MADDMRNHYADQHELRPTTPNLYRSQSQLSAISHASEWARDTASEISRVSRDGGEWFPTNGRNEDVGYGTRENLLQEPSVMNISSAPNIATKKESVMKHDENLDGEPASQSHSKHSWLPVTLQLPYLIMLTLLSLALGATVIFLTAYSRTSNGLGNDDGSARILIGWRFSPTLAAVIYTVLVTTMLQDVRRTEVFARLSKNRSVLASASLCWPLRCWWNDPVDALTKSRNNGIRSWALFLAAIVNILGFLVISPLSAAFLSPEYVEIVTDTPFQRYDTSSGLAIRTESSDETMFRTISASLLNASTSAWITNDYFVTPFWPSALDTIPLSSTFTASQLPQKWTGPTMVFRTEMDCSPLKLDSTSNTTAFDVGVLQNVTDADNVTSINWNMTGIHMSTSDGCSINVYELSPEGTANNLVYGGGWWARSLSKLSAVVPPEYANTVSNGTGSCGQRSFLFYNNIWAFNQSLSIGGDLCTTKYLQAEVIATVTMTNTGSNVTFNDAEFQQKQAPLDTNKYDLDLIEDSFFTSNWSVKLKVPGSSLSDSIPYFHGPLQAIAAGSVYNYSIPLMMEGSTLLSQARRFQQQWLGQLLLRAMENTATENIAHSTVAQVIITERRIVAVTGIGLVLGSLLVFSGCCIIAVSFLTRLHRRPLNLSYDPANIAVSTALIATSGEIQSLFEGCERATPQIIQDSLTPYRFSLQDGKLLMSTLTTLKEEHSSQNSKRKAQNPRPIVLRAWMGPLLVISLFVLIAVLIALYQVSITKGLSQSALTYELNFSIADKVSRFAPYSIAPTLVAVAFKLWYAAVEETLKRQQPFYSMSSAPTPVSRSVLAEYVNAPLFLTSIKAITNSHWMLALVGLGALGTEIFTVGMSALWDRENVPRMYHVNVSQQLELRTVPSVYTTQATGAGVHHDLTRPVVMNSVYGSYLTSWLYTATVEMSQGASPPAWSNDTWSFVPVDLAASQEAIASALPSSLSGSNTAVNVTVETQALHARLECKPVDYITNTSLWLSKWDFNNKTIDPETNKTMWNSTNRPQNLDIGYELHPNILIPGSMYDSIPMGGSVGTLDCCSNITNNVPGEAAIGYWSAATNTTYIKWIVGKPLEGRYNDSYREPTEGIGIMDHQHWLWADQPQLQAVQCSPVIEQANATVTVDLVTGTVRNYTINDVPRNVTAAWSDDYLIRNQASNILGAQNLTVSYGYVFWDALLSASNVLNYGSEFQFYTNVQDQDDHAFNFRIRGLNTDLMSYSMFSLVNDDKYALLDADTLMEKASYAFGVFFKHYVSNNVTYDEGGLAYQAIGARLSQNLSESIEPGTGYVNSDTVDLPVTKQIIVQVPVEMLVMSPAAVFLCLGVLGFLVVTVIFIYGVYHSRFNALPRDVDSLASVLALVHASQALLDWAGDREKRNDWADKNVRKGLYARMGSFKSQEGVEKWGVELEKSVAGADLPLLQVHRRGSSTA